MKIDVKLEKEDLKLLARMQAVCNSLKCHECPLFETSLPSRERELKW